MRDGVLKSGFTFHYCMRSVQRIATHVEYYRALPVRHSGTAPDRSGCFDPARLSLILSAPEGTLVDHDNSAATWIAASRPAEMRSAA